ncbi:MAG: hypothetical protein HWN67_09365 [Candidatus Helarchaeota archaeon]|nr:hypothetical protein [Candidatus Helarchaeota archaeon]
MAEEEEPPIQYYEILEHKTISKRGRWWTLLTLLKDTEKDQTFLSIYKFQKRTNKNTEEKYWAKHSSFRINNIKHAETLVESLKDLMVIWEE